MCRIGAMSPQRGLRTVDCIYNRNGVQIHVVSAVTGLPLRSASGQAEFHPRVPLTVLSRSARGLKLQGGGGSGAKLISWSISTASTSPPTTLPSSEHRSTSETPQSNEGPRERSVCRLWLAVVVRFSRARAATSSREGRHSSLGSSSRSAALSKRRSSGPFVAAFFGLDSGACSGAVRTT